MGRRKKQKCEIFFPGDVPSKKNNKIMIVVRGRRMLIPGKFYNKWHKEMQYEIMAQKPVLGLEKATVEIIFFPRTKRSADLSNKAESIMDFLVDYGVIKDDNWYCVPKLVLKFGKVDREKPGAHVIINY